MIQYKQDIRCADFEAAVRKSLIKVDGMKHATPQAKKEFYEVLINLRDDLIRWNENDIEIPGFMRETR